MESLAIHSIFQSIEGEISPFHQGKISTFIRLAGCNCTCAYCDSRYADKINRRLSTKKLIQRFYKAQIKKFNSHKVTITGGEPLLQEEGVNYLIELLLKDNIPVTVETNGSIYPKLHIFNPLIGYVVDYKLPSSGMEDKMDMKWMNALTQYDVLKFVIGDSKDYRRAKEVLKLINNKAIKAFQVVYGGLDTRILLNWMIRDGVTEPILSVQIHKILGLK